MNTDKIKQDLDIGDIIKDPRILTIFIAAIYLLIGKLYSYLYTMGWYIGILLGIILFLPIIGYTLTMIEYLIKKFNWFNDNYIKPFGDRLTIIDIATIIMFKLLIFYICIVIVYR